MLIRAEHEGDFDSIAELTALAFASVEHSDQTEPAVIAALRFAGALSISLVAEDEGRIIGHIAFSPITINESSWVGLAWGLFRYARIGSAKVSAQPWSCGGLAFCEAGRPPDAWCWAIRDITGASASKATVRCDTKTLRLNISCGCPSGTSLQRAKSNIIRVSAHAETKEGERHRHSPSLN